MSKLSNSYSVHSLHTSFKSNQKLPKICNLSTTPTLTSGLVSRLKTRNQKSEFEISPQYAAQVVKNYLLPMFESAKSHQKDLNRHQLMGLTSEYASRDSTAESSVYKELKLSERLLNELETLKTELEEAKHQASLCEQEKFELRAEIQNLTREKEEVCTNLKFTNMQSNLSVRSYQTYEMKTYMMQKQLDNYKKMISSSKEKLNLVSQDLHSELNKNDIRLIPQIYLNSHKQVKIRTNQTDSHEQYDGNRKSNNKRQVSWTTKLILTINREKK